MYPQYWTPSMGVFLCPRSSIASQEISATFKQHICDMQFAVVANKSKMRIAIVPEENENPNPSPIGNRFGFFLFGGRGWIRTTEAEKQQIYSLSPLATREHAHILCVYCRTTCLVYHRFLDLSTSFFISFSFVAIFKNSAGQNGIFAICSLVDVACALKMQLL